MSPISNDNLCALRKLPPPSAMEPEREKSLRKEKVVIFEADGEVLNLNDRLHPCVSDIEYYKRNTETILENNHCIRGT